MIYEIRDQVLWSDFVDYTEGHDRISSNSRVCLDGLIKPVSLYELSSNLFRYIMNSTFPGDVSHSCFAHAQYIYSKVKNHTEAALFHLRVLR